MGRDHTLLGGATLASNLYGRGFAVENLNFFGDGGVSTALGEADSGVFIYPYTFDVAEGYFMRGQLRRARRSSAALTEDSVRYAWSARR